MNDNDIIKALEHCRIGKRENDCKKCPLYGRVPACVGYLAQNALALINRQKAEIERLYIANKINQKFTETWKDIAHRETGYVKIARAEAIKEFAERLRNKFFNYYDGLTEHTSKSNHNGDSLMFYEVADMITDCIESTEEEMTEGEDA